MPMPDSLATIENLEYRAVALLAGFLRPADRTSVEKSLDDLRVAKRRLLGANPGILRKVTREPAAGDRPNAAQPTPDGSNGVAERVFRAPKELHGLSIHTCRGAIAVADHGIVTTAGSHEDLHAELRGRGFKEMRQVDRAGKCLDGSDPSAAFHRSRLRPIGGVDVLRGLSDRACKAAVAVLPSESRLEAPDGPGPRPTYATSAKAFRRAFFGEEN
jgi:hypothetical protein